MDQRGRLSAAAAGWAGLRGAGLERADGGTASRPDPHPAAALCRGLTSGPGPADDDPAALAAAAAIEDAWTLVVAHGRGGLAEAEALLEGAVAERCTAAAAAATAAAPPPHAVTAALHDALAAVAFLRGARPALAEREAASAVSAAAAAGAPPAAAARCVARHGATLVGVGRYAAAAAVLLDGDAGPEAAFFGALARAAVGGGHAAAANPAALPPALVSAAVTSPPPPAIAPLLEAAALREMRRAVDAAVGEGDWGRAVALAAAEVDSHAALAAAKRREAGGVEGGHGRSGGGGQGREEDRGDGSGSGRAREGGRATDAALHAQYRLATLRFAAGDPGAVAEAEAASAAADDAWGAGDDRAVLRAHRLAVARAAALVEEGDGRMRLSPDEVEAAAVRARDRFRTRLGRGAGLAGEAAAAVALARLAGLRRGEGGPALDAFTAVLAPRRRKEAVAELREGLAVMAAAYGADHVLTVRLRGLTGGVLEE